MICKDNYDHLVVCVQYHLAMAQYWGEMALALSDALILPFNALAYAQAVNTYAAQVERLDGALMRENGLTSGLGM